MPAQTWASKAQLEFLNGKLIEFANAQRDKRVSSFWTGVHHDFFELWPNRASEIASHMQDTPRKKRSSKIATSESADLTEDKWIEGRKSNIYNWFNNHALQKGQRAGKVNTLKISTASSSSRVSTLTHLYSRKYYETRVKEHVEREIAGRNIDEGQRLAIINKHLTRTFGNESAEVKEEIRILQEQERHSRDEAKDIEKQLAHGEDLSPEQLLVGQAALPGLIQEFCVAMNKRTGWWFTVLAGGPDPSQDGAIQTLSISTGENAYGRTFARAYGQFNDGILKPFSSFLQTGFSTEARERFRPRKSEDHEIPTEKSAPTQIDGNFNVADEQKAISFGEATPSTPGKSPVAASSVLPVPPSTSISEVQTTKSVNEAAPSEPGQLPVAAGGVPPVPPPLTLITPSDSGQLPIDVLPLPPLTSQLHQTPGCFQTPSNPRVFPAVTAPLTTLTAGLNVAHTADSINQPGPSIMGFLPHPQVALAETPFHLDHEHRRSDFLQSQSFQFPTPSPGIYGLGFNGGFLGHMESSSVQGYNTLTGTQESWLLAQNPGGNLGFDANSWDFGPNLMATEANIPRPTDHPLPNQESNTTSQLEELGTRIRKPTGRKEVVPLTEIGRDDGMPEWLNLAMGYLKEGVGRNDWIDCVEAWFKFEKMMGFQNSTSHRLSTKSRPELLSKWLQSRKYDAMPDISDRNAFGSSWCTWWNSVQPKWRQESTDGSLPHPVSLAKDNDHLNALKKGGASGLITALIGLKWWRPLTDSDSDENWKAAVKDFTGCLEFISDTGRGTKRKHNEEHKTNKSKRKK